MAKNNLQQAMSEVHERFVRITSQSMNKDEIKDLIGGVNYLNNVIHAVDTKIKKRNKQEKKDDELHISKLKKMNLELLPD